MSREKTALPDDLLQQSQRFEEWRGAHPPRTRLPEPMWDAAVEMAQRHGLHCTTKALRLDYMRLKKRLPSGTQPPRSAAAPAFLELLAAPTTGPECVVELESGGGRLRVSMKGAALDWASLLHAWRGAAR
jgi:hypothetical protein